MLRKIIEPDSSSLKTLNRKIQMHDPEQALKTIQFGLKLRFQRNTVGGRLKKTQNSSRFLLGTGEE